MTKTEKNLNFYVDATINGFRLSLENARENGWKYGDLQSLLDNDYDLCYGAMLFAYYYENKIDGDKFNALRDKLREAKYQIAREFLGIA